MDVAVGGVGLSLVSAAQELGYLVVGSLEAAVKITAAQG
ncbi:hypothetical protein HaLaN_09369 [Haematococcus lacustris]|uniref:Uncharacterized protein n=1 Tax=Haematococcus lacustris TaxID=44745 RepID=A0A699Z2H1_HAELA|nr:hypothetical protein HaLaN_09369 [Haematococcus lacustris]